MEPLRLLHCSIAGSAGLLRHVHDQQFTQQKQHVEYIAEVERDQKKGSNKYKQQLNNQALTGGTLLPVPHTSPLPVSRPDHMSPMLPGSGWSSMFQSTVPKPDPLPQSQNACWSPKSNVDSMLSSAVVRGS